MGLDMYLFKCKKIKDLGIDLTIAMNGKFARSEDAEDADLRRFLEKYSYLEKRELDTAKYHYTYKKVAYWRKANQLHKWFYESCSKDNQKDYDPIHIDKNHLVEIVEIVQDIIKNKDVVDYAKNNLPTQSGFFFGSLDYDSSYYEDCYLTIKQVNAILENLEDDEIVYYYASY